MSFVSCFYPDQRITCYGKNFYKTLSIPNLYCDLQIIIAKKNPSSKKYDTCGI